MKNKGFTLVELLAIIIILSVIALIVVPNLVGNVNNYKERLNEMQIQSIENAARIWGSDNMFALPNDSESENVCYYSNIDNCDDNYKTLVINLSLLQNGGYISDDVKNVVTKNDLPDLEIHIVKNGNRLDYQVIYES